MVQKGRQTFTCKSKFSLLPGFSPGLGELLQPYVEVSEPLPGVPPTRKGGDVTKINK